MKNIMNTRYRLIHRGLRKGMYYSLDKQTGKRRSLQTRNASEARQILKAKNIAERQPALNQQIARAYLAGSDSGVNTRTWLDAMEMIIQQKHGSNQERWRRAVQDRAFDRIRNKLIIETKGEDFLKVLQAGTVSTNVFLRKIHNFCLDMNWLPWPLVPRRQWPPVRYKDKRGITREEHQRIVAREPNPETRAFYQMAWHLGASQSDLANLRAEDVDWEARIICFVWMKTRRRSQQPAQIRFGSEVQEILAGLPRSGFLFTRLAPMDEKHRAKEFRRRCLGLGIDSVSLHSYRYA